MAGSVCESASANADEYARMNAESAAALAHRRFNRIRSEIAITE
jgi:hypothetical protein